MHNQHPCCHHNHHHAHRHCATHGGIVGVLGGVINLTTMALYGGARIIQTVVDGAAWHADHSPYSCHQHHGHHHHGDCRVGHHDCCCHD